MRYDMAPIHALTCCLYVDYTYPNKWPYTWHMMWHWSQETTFLYVSNMASMWTPSTCTGWHGTDVALTSLLPWALLHTQYWLGTWHVALSLLLSCVWNYNWCGWVELDQYHSRILLLSNYLHSQSTPIIASPMSNKYVLDIPNKWLQFPPIFW